LGLDGKIVRDGEQPGSGHVSIEGVRYRVNLDQLEAWQEAVRRIFPPLYFILVRLAPEGSRSPSSTGYILLTSGAESHLYRGEVALRMAAEDAVAQWHSYFGSITEVISPRKDSEPKLRRVEGPPEITIVGEGTQKDFDLAHLMMQSAAPGLKASPAFPLRGQAAGRVMAAVIAPSDTVPAWRQPLRHGEVSVRGPVELVQVALAVFRQLMARFIPTVADRYFYHRTWNLFGLKEQAEKLKKRAEIREIRDLFRQAVARAREEIKAYRSAYPDLDDGQRVTAELSLAGQTRRIVLGAAALHEDATQLVSLRATTISSFTCGRPLCRIVGRNRPISGVDPPKLTQRVVFLKVGHSPSEASLQHDGASP
jgi:hypothetical protein